MRSSGRTNCTAVNRNGRPSRWVTDILCPLGIDKITEKAQMSEEGTMVSVAVPPPAAAGNSDTESNSDRDHEVATVAAVSVRLTRSSPSWMVSPVRSATLGQKRRAVKCRASPRRHPGAPVQTGLVETSFRSSLPMNPAVYPADVSFR